MLQLMGVDPVRLRISISVAIGVVTTMLAWAILSHLQLGAADFNWAILAARDLLAHKNPYDTLQQLYPLPAALFGLPFVWMRPDIAGSLFYGISSTLLAFGLTRHSYWPLLAFLAYPYWSGMLSAQWTPLIAASAFFPLLLPATIAKPQIGLPVALTQLTRRGVLACAVVLALSLIVMPSWPPQWVAHFSRYDRFVPLLVLPGPLLALSLLRYRDRDAWLLFLAALVPQRWFYDSFILWLIPKTRREFVWTMFFSWAPGIWRWYHIPHSYTEVGRWMVIFIYLPMLVVVLSRGLPHRPVQNAVSRGNLLPHIHRSPR